MAASDQFWAYCQRQAEVRPDGGTFAVAVALAAVADAINNIGGPLNIAANIGSELWAIVKKENEKGT